MIKKLIMITITIFLLTGCNSTEVTERAFVKAIYADKSEGNIYLDILYTTPEGEDKIFVSKGKDFSSAITFTKNTIGKDIFTDHCEIIFVGAGITDIKKDLSYLSQSRAFPIKMIICKCAYKNVLSAENIDSFSSIVSEEKGEDYGTLFSVFSGENNEYPIATLKDNYIILF